MRYNSIAAIVAAEITASVKLRSRSVQLTPRAFHLLSRRRTISSTARRSLQSTALRRNEPTESVLSGEPSAVQDEKSRETLSTGSAVSTGNHDTAQHVPREKPKDKKLRGLFLDAMRTVPHPVAVVTARKQDVKDENDVQGTVAATVSSFNTVSIDPDLVVSFNLKSDSTTYRTILESKKFTVTFAQTNEAGANLVHSFTKGNDPSPFTAEFPDHPTPQLFTWPSHSILDSEYATPAVALTAPDDSQSGFAFALPCQYQTSIPVADHVIVIGRVQKRIRTVASGFGSQPNPGFVPTNHVALAHVHGKYSSSTSPSISNSLKEDDKSLVSRSDIQNRIDWCTQRLKLLAQAQMVQKGTEVTKALESNTNLYGVRNVTRASNIPSRILEEYERYYMQRVLYLEYQAAKLKQGDTSSTLRAPKGSVPESDEAQKKLVPELDEVLNVPYNSLSGYQQLFIRNKMLLTMEELDEEIALYTMRLSALRIEAEKDAAAQVFEEENEPGEELAPEETQSKIDLNPEADGLSRNMQLRAYFSARVGLLQHAKNRKAEFTPKSVKTKPGVKIIKTYEKTPPEELATKATARFRGANKDQPISALKTKYRRYQHQVTEAQLTLIGLEGLQGHPYIPILKERFAYYGARVKAVEDLLQERVKNVPTESLVDSFKLPTMSTPRTEEEEEADMGPMYRLKHLRTQNFKPIDPKLIRKQLAPEVRRIRQKEGDSVDQLDDDEDFRVERSQQMQAAVRAAAQKLPVGRPMAGRESARVRTATYHVPPDEEAEAEEDLKRMEDMDRNLLRDNASQVRDYLVMQGVDEEIPSPNDFVDVKKLHAERMRKEQQEED